MLIFFFLGNGARRHDHPPQLHPLQPEPRHRPGGRRQLRRPISRVLAKDSASSARRPSPPTPPETPVSWCSCRQRRRGIDHRHGNAQRQRRRVAGHVGVLGKRAGADAGADRARGVSFQRWRHWLGSGVVAVGLNFWQSRNLGPGSEVNPRQQPQHGSAGQERKKPSLEEPATYQAIGTVMAASDGLEEMLGVGPGASLLVNTKILQPRSSYR